MSEKLSNMLRSLPHTQEKVFIYKNEESPAKLSESCDNTLSQKQA